MASQFIRTILKVIRPDTLVIIDKTPKRETPNREPVKLKTLEVDPPQRETPKKNVGGYLPTYAHRLPNQG